MNAQTTISTHTGAPAIGTPLDLTSGGLAYVVDVKPCERATFTLIGGPAPMTRDRFTITAANAAGYIGELSENIAAPMIERARYVAPISEAEAAALWETAKAARAETRRRNMAAAEDAKRKADAVKAEIAKHRPAWAQAAIVATLEHDDCDSLTDYFNVTRSRRVIIGWSKHTRDLFPEMRKAAARFPETAHLADAPESAEHREKWSMGGGYFLKAGSRYCDGWKISKERLGQYFGGPEYEIADCAKAGAPTDETGAPAPTGEGGGNISGLFRISQHTHTRKGFQMWICELVERVEREDFDRFLSAAKERGGWYSRAWQGTPAGFAFKSEAAALAFTGQGGGDSPAPTDGNKPARVIEPAPAANLADKLRALADGMQAAIDDKNRDRPANTPKRRRQAAEARQDAAQLERAQAILRALAACHDAGTVPECLRGVTTKAAAVELAREEIDRSRAGYYDAGLPTGRPYDWAAVRKPEQAERAAAAWALLDAAKDAERRAQEELRQKLEALRFAKIPGYFPTPAGLVARMIEAAELAPGSRVLEPSAGSGAIADALRDAGHAVDCIERDSSLRAILTAKGHNLIGHDFTEETPEAYPAPLYDAVIMNPPFENGQDCDHVARAWGFVKPGGALVAIMGAGVQFRNSRPYSVTRDWLESEGAEIVEIPAGTFKESGTGVASVMVTLRKPCD